MSPTDAPLVAMDNLYIPSELRQVAEQVAQGERPVFTVRVLLSWFFGSKRRGRWIVSVIREALDKLDLQTQPDFNSTYPDNPVAFIPKSKPQEVAAATTVESGFSADAVLITPESVSVTPIDPTYRIGRLGMADRPPVSVTPDASVEHAVTLMLMHDFSQLPVMTSERKVTGLLSWKSLGSRWSQGHECARVDEAMDQYAEIGSEASIFDVTNLLREHDCVLVRDEATHKISGIITSYDISLTFGELSEPFLVLNEIENHIRRLIEGNFTATELVEARDPSDAERPVEKAADLSFGEYIRLLENPQNWSKLGLQIDRVLFIKRLDEIRRIRNDVMHFDPEGTDPNDQEKLRDFVEFLRRLQEISSRATKPSR